MTLINRLEKLEKIRQDQPVRWIDVIEIHKTYDDGREVIEVMDLQTAKPSEILAAAGRLMDQGAQPTAEQRRALDFMGTILHEQS